MACKEMIGASTLVIGMPSVLESALLDVFCMVVAALLAAAVLGMTI